LLRFAIDGAWDPKQVLAPIRAEWPDLPVIARAFDRVHTIALRQAGVEHVTRETLESAVIMGRDVLDLAGHLSTEVAWEWDRAAGAWSITDLAAAGTARVIQAAGIEALAFADRSVWLPGGTVVGDIDGSGTSDILWRHATGTLATAEMRACSPSPRLKASLCESTSTSNASTA
jgi:hypothetical protein